MSKIILKEDNVISRIYYIRGLKTMLDFDLAQLYNVETRVLKQAAKRNIHRFPEDFMFQLTRKEWKELITNCDKLGAYKFSPASPFVFTEHGTVMLASVLNSSIAVEASIFVVRAFVKLRSIGETYKELESKLKELEKITRSQYKNHSGQLALIFETLHELVEDKKQREAPRKRIGYKTNNEV